MSQTANDAPTPTTPSTDDWPVLERAVRVLNHVAANEDEARATQLAAIRAVEQIDKIIQRWRRDDIAARRAAIKAAGGGAASAGESEAR